LKDEATYHKSNSGFKSSYISLSELNWVLGKLRRPSRPLIMSACCCIFSKSENIV
jgi:hypothetical protein